MGRGMEVCPLTHIIYWCLLNPCGPDAEFPLHRNFSLSDQVIPSFWWAALITQILGIPLSFIYSCASFQTAVSSHLCCRRHGFPPHSQSAQCSSVAYSSTQHLYPCLVSLVSSMNTIESSPEWQLNLNLNWIWNWIRIWTRGWTCSEALSYPESHLKLHLISWCSISWLLSPVSSVLWRIATSELLKDGGDPITSAFLIIWRRRVCSGFSQNNGF